MLLLAGSCTRVPARTATTTELLRVHTADHLQRLRLFCSGAVPATIIPSDTYINQHTLHCAALAAGSAADAAVRVVRGEAACGAAIIRPPGHHAESNTAMGFCFFNNAAVAARAAQAAGAERVLILDWDVSSRWVCCLLLHSLGCTQQQEVFDSSRQSV
jgi:histone deacetylase 6